MRSTYFCLLLLLSIGLFVSAQEVHNDNDYEIMDVDMIDLDHESELYMDDETGDLYQISGAGDDTSALYQQGGFAAAKKTQQLQTLTLPTTTKTLATQTVQGAPKTLQPITLAPVVNKQYVDQTVNKAPIVHRQKVVRQVLIEQPIVRTHLVTQPVIRPIVTQPIVRPHIFQAKKTQQYLVNQPIVKPRFTDKNIVQQQVIDQPITAKTRTEQPTYTLTQGEALAPFVQEQQSKKGQQFYGDDQQQYQGMYGGF